MLTTKVFDLASAYGYRDGRELARAMGISDAMLSRVKSGEQKITAPFIAGAQRAFPDKTLDELFTVETERAIV